MSLKIFFSCKQIYNEKVANTKVHEKRPLGDDTVVNVLYVYRYCATK
jgi:hypothetical protein